MTAVQAYAEAAMASSEAAPPQNATRTINDLPDELLLAICSSLHTLSDLDSLPSVFYSLSLVSRKWNIIVTPFLYHTFHYDATLHRSLRFFICSLLGSPRLASHVKVINVDDWEPTTSPWVTDDGAPDCERSMIDFVNGCRFPPKYAARWKQALIDRVIDAEVALLFFLVPNLEELVLLMPDLHERKGERFWPHRLLFEALDDPTIVRVHAFDKLKKLNVSAVDGDYHIGPFSNFFRLPALEKFYSCGASDSTGHVDLYAWPRGSSAVTSIELTENFLDAYSLSILIRACSSLKKFEVTQSFLWEGIHGLGFRELFDALRLHKDSLEELKINPYTPIDVTGSSVDHNLSTFKDLHMFSMLKKLYIAEIASLGDMLPPSSTSLVEILPQSMENFGYELYSVDTTSETRLRLFADSICHLLETCSHTHPNLRWLTITAESQLWYDVEERMRKANKSNVEIRCEMVEY